MMEGGIKTLGYIVGKVFAMGVLLSVGLLLAIWAFNTLSPGLIMPVTLSTWFATSLLMIYFWK